MSEEMVVRQCAPTLAGIKTGSLFPCPCTDRDALLDEVRQLNRRLSPKGLCLLPLRFTEGSALLYLYRPATLRRDLSDDLARRLLADPVSSFLKVWFLLLFFCHLFRKHNDPELFKSDDIKALIPICLRFSGR